MITNQEIIIAGFGGQGVLSMGQLLVYAAMIEGKEVSWMPSYGPEMRGGTANCTVIISDEEIGSPLVRRPSAAIVLNPPSFERYEPLVQTDGLLLVNASLVSAPVRRQDIRRYDIKANEEAAELGTPQMANMILVGALVAATGVLKMETLDQVLEERVSARHRDKLQANKEALRRGAAFVTATQVRSPA